MSDMHQDPYELAVLLFMNGKSEGFLKDECERCVLGMEDQPSPWFMEPGRGHVPSEMGGRIASPQNPDLNTDPNEDSWLEAFDVGHRVSDFQSLGLDVLT